MRRRRKPTRRTESATCRAMVKSAVPHLVSIRMCNEVPATGIAARLSTATWITILHSVGWPKPRSHARAGADIVAPSDMMDGRVGAIRHHSMPMDFRRRQSLRTRLNSRRYFMGRSARRPSLHRSSATGAATRWTLLTGRGDARDGARSGGGRRHVDGQAGHALPDLTRQARDRFPVPIGASIKFPASSG